VPVCIRIVFKLLCFCSLFLLLAAHVANKVVYNVRYSDERINRFLTVVKMTIEQS